MQREQNLDQLTHVKPCLLPLRDPFQILSTSTAVSFTGPNKLILSVGILPQKSFFTKLTDGKQDVLYQ